MKTLIFKLFVLNCFVLTAQQIDVQGIVEDQNEQPIAYANILLKTVADSTVVKGISSNDFGAFKLSNLKPDTYLLEVSFIGYKTVLKSVVLKETTDIGTIVLSEDAEALSEVTITVKKPTLKKQADRLVFEVENTALSEGNIMNVLKNTPGVLVLDDVITVKNTTPTVYINNRKVHLSPEDLALLLQGSQAEAMQSVEVITNPPAKYDADGKTVLLINTKKNIATGYRGNLFANYTQGVFPRYNGGYSNFFKTKKVNFYASYNYTHDKIDRTSDELINYKNGSVIRETWNTTLDRNSWSNKHNGKLNIDYSIDDRNTLSLAVNTILLPYFKYKTTGQTTIGNNPILSGFTANNNAFDKKYDTGVDLDFIHKLKKGASLAINMHFTNYDYERDQNVNSLYFNTGKQLDRKTAYKTDSKQHTDILTSQIDVEIPLENVSLSTGVKTSIITTQSNINQYDKALNGYFLDVNNTDAYNYDESILAAYFSLDKEWEKWQLSLGLRAENTSVEGVSLSTKTTNKNDYLEFFPTANLSYQASENVTIYSNYSRSIERPNYQSLNPFRFYLNDNTIVTGNPNLQPSFNSYSVLGLSLNDTYTFEAYYSNTTASFFELPFQDNVNNKIYFVPTNLSKTYEYGLDFVTFLNVAKRWGVYFVTSVYNTTDEAVFNNQSLKRNMWSNLTSINNDVSFLKDSSLKANFTATYIHNNLQGFRTIKSRLATQLTLRKSVFKKRANITLIVSDLFNTQDFEITSQYLDQDNTNKMNIDNRYIKLGFNYKLGNYNLSTNERSVSKKERDRLEKKQ